MSREVGVLVVGYGASGRKFHCPLLRMEPGLKVVGVVARGAELRDAAAREQGVAVHADLAAGLADPRVGLVVIATPHVTHAPLACEALAAGKHVVVDKIICLTSAELAAMRAAADKAGTLLTAFQNRRWDWDHLTLARLVADGRLGTLRWLEVAWNKPISRGTWRARRAAGGGRLLDLGTHLLDQILLLAGRMPDGVHCRMHHDDPEADVESHCQVLLTFGPSFTAVIDVTAIAFGQKPRIYAVGSGGTFTKFGIDPQEAALFAGDIAAAAEPAADVGRLRTTAGDEPIPSVRGDWRSFYANVAATIAGSAPPAVTLDQMARLVRVQEAAFESARTGDVVRIAE